MQPPHRNRRVAIIAVGAIMLAGAGTLTAVALNRNISYFYTPSQVVAQGIQPGERIRLGGLVEVGSIDSSQDLTTTFRVMDTDFTTFDVTYTGILPDLFRDGQGVIAQGRFGEDGIFVAETILAKHDENYIPKELMDVMHEFEAGGQTAAPGS
ncbi:MAG: cytochrome c maturation protein CcmE [Pseudomonadota bacterium]